MYTRTILLSIGFAVFAGAVAVGPNSQTGSMSKRDLIFGRSFQSQSCTDIKCKTEADCDAAEKQLGTKCWGCGTSGKCNGPPPSYPPGDARNSDRSGFGKGADNDYGVAVSSSKGAAATKHPAATKKAPAPAPTKNAPASKKPEAAVPKKPAAAAPVKGKGSRKGPEAIDDTEGAEIVEEME